MPDNLLLLKVTGNKGSITRDVIVSDTITFFNLHRCIQFCVKPRQSDSTVQGKAFTFESSSTKKPVKGTKTAQLCGNSQAKVGDCYTYEADATKYKVEVVDRHPGDGRHYVPRCIAGKNGTASADLDATNGKLLVRRFSKRGVGQLKKPPPVLAPDTATNADLMRCHMNAMLGGLRWKEDMLSDLDQFGVEKVLEAYMLNKTRPGAERQVAERNTAAIGNGGSQSPAASTLVPGAAATAVAASSTPKVHVAAEGSNAATAFPGASAAAVEATTMQPVVAATTVAATTEIPTLGPSVGPAPTSIAPPPAVVQQPCSKATKATKANNSILKYFAKQPNRG